MAGGRGTFGEHVVVDIERERFEIRRRVVVERVGVVVISLGTFTHPSYDDAQSARNSSSRDDAARDITLRLSRRGRLDLDRASVVDARAAMRRMMSRGDGRYVVYGFSHHVFLFIFCRDVPRRARSRRAIGRRAAMPPKKKAAPAPVEEEEEEELLDYDEVADAGVDAVEADGEKMMGKMRTRMPRRRVTSGYTAPGFGTFCSSRNCCERSLIAGSNTRAKVRARDVGGGGNPRIDAIRGSDGLIRWIDSRVSVARWTPRAWMRWTPRRARVSRPRERAMCDGGKD